MSRDLFFRDELGGVTSSSPVEERVVGEWRMEGRAQGDNHVPSSTCGLNKRGVKDHFGYLASPGHRGHM